MSTEVCNPILEWRVHVEFVIDGDDRDRWSNVSVSAETPTEAELVAAQLVMSRHLADTHGHVTLTRILGEPVA